MTLAVFLLLLLGSDAGHLSRAQQAAYTAALPGVTGKDAAV